MGIGLSTAILKGQKGAEDAVTSSIGAAVGAAFGPAFAGPAKELAALLAKGPEATKEAVREFVNGVPVIVEAIADSAPIFVEALVDSLVNKGGAFKIGLAIGRAMSGEAFFKAAGKQLGISFGEQLNIQNIGGTIAGKINASIANIGPAFTNGISRMVSGITTAFSIAASQIGAAISGVFNGVLAQLSAVFQVPIDFFRGLYEQLVALFGSFAENIKGLFKFKIPEFPTPGWVNDLKDFLAKFEIKLPGSGGGSGTGIISSRVGGVVGGVAKSIGLAGGGQIPAGFPNDSFGPVGLQSHELVVPPGMTAELGDFLASQKTGKKDEGNAVTNALLGKIVTLLANPVNVQTTAQVSGEAFANIMLKLSRNNARLTA